MDRRNNKDNETDPYHPESLSQENYLLFKQICTYVSGRQAPIFTNNANLRHKERESFRKFISCAEKHKKDFENYFLKYSKAKEVKTLKDICKPRGIGLQSIEAAFRASAFINEKSQSLAEHLQSYILYCGDFKPRAFAGHEDTIKILLETNFTEHKNTKKEELLLQGILKHRKQHKDLPSESSLNIQDSIAIDEKLDKISQDCGFYPQVKNKLIRDIPSIFGNSLIKINRLLVNCPEHSRLLSYKVTLLCLLKKETEALNISTSLYKLRPNDNGIIAAHAYAIFKNNRIKDSIDILKKGVELHPYDTGIFLSIANMYDRLDLLEDAVKYYKKTIDLDPDYIYGYYRISLIYYRTEQYDEAKEILEVAFSKSLRDPTLYSLHQSARFRKYETFGDALLLLISIKKIGVRYFVLLLKIIIKILTLNFTGIKKSFKEEAKRVSKNPVRRSVFLSSLYGIAGSYNFLLFSLTNNNKKYLLKAESRFNKALEIHDLSVHSLIEISVIYILKNEIGKAKLSLGKAASFYNTVDYFSLRGFRGYKCYIDSYKSLYRSQEKESSQLPLKWAIENNEDHISIYVEYAYYLIKGKNYKEAKIYADKAKNYYNTYHNDQFLTMSLAMYYYKLALILSIIEELYDDKGYHYRSIIKILDFNNNYRLKNWNKKFIINVLEKRSHTFSLLGNFEKNIEFINDAISQQKLILNSISKFKNYRQYKKINRNIEKYMNDISNIKNIGIDL